MNIEETQESIVKLIDAVKEKYPNTSDHKTGYICGLNHLQLLMGQPKLKSLSNEISTWQECAKAIQEVESLSNTTPQLDKLHSTFDTLSKYYMSVTEEVEGMNVVTAYNYRESQELIDELQAMLDKEK